MKFKTFMLSALILTAIITVRAKVIPLRPFPLDRDITVNGARVPQGMYSLAVDSEGNSVRATLYKEGQFVATAHGTWVKHGVKYRENAVLLKVNSDGTRSLSEIRLAGSARSIVIDNENPILQIAPGAGGGGRSANRTIN